MLSDTCVSGNGHSIIQFREVFLTPDYLAIAMEFAPGGDMFQYVKRKKGLQARTQPNLLRHSCWHLHKETDCLCLGKRVRKGLSLPLLHTLVCPEPNSCNIVVILRKPLACPSQRGAQSSPA